MDLEWCVDMGKHSRIDGMDTHNLGFLIILTILIYVT